MGIFLSCTNYPVSKFKFKIPNVTEKKKILKSSQDVMDEYSYFLYILVCVSCVQLEQLCARCVSDVQEEERGGGGGERPHLTPLQTSEQRKLRQEKEGDDHEVAGGVFALPGPPDHLHR